ncbi:hypothetical protein RN001_005888 [Aquatica leii]|uniref:Ferritin n=1 Tax=Aquatica leii TaxID=1421715 RepID=A0AAN7SJ95_9COLE|nr:hypothetical protein RN001_005888 [Aquatica leii]
MKVLCVFVSLLAAAFAVNNGVCYKGIEEFCSHDKKEINPEKCNSKYGGINKALPHLQEYVKNHIVLNFEYMLMSTYFGNYQKSREGFEKLFMDLSNSKWEKAIDLIKHITKRGGEMDFTKMRANIPNNNNEVYELYEINSLAKALEIEKDMAEAAYHIHGQASERSKDFHDPEIVSYIENEFIHKDSETIRKLSGHVSDLTKLLDSPDSSLALYVFDDYLNKVSIV